MEWFRRFAIGSAWANNIWQRSSHCTNLAWHLLLGLGAAFGNLAQKTPKGEELILNALTHRHYPKLMQQNLDMPASDIYTMTIA